MSPNNWNCHLSHKSYFKGHLIPQRQVRVDLGPKDGSITWTITKRQRLNKMEAILNECYKNLDQSSALTSINKLYKCAKPTIPQLTLDNVKAWRQKQDVYTLHKLPRCSFKHRRVYVSVLMTNFKLICVTCVQ